MEAKFEVRGEIMVVELKGKIDFETADPFRRTCLERLTGEKVVFDLRHLNFVGSLGLTEFVDTLDHMARKSQTGVRLCGVSSEFRRLFEASEGIGALQFFETSERAVASFTSSQLSLI